MRTNNFLSILCLTVISLMSNVSCESGDENGDTTRPVINLIEPAQDDVLEIGESVHFEMEVSDNDQLREYKVEIHSNFDGHQHSALRAGEYEGETVDFFFEHTWSDISGKKNAMVHHHEIVIPANATPGDYHLEVFCTDASGNEAFVVRDIELSYEGGEHDHDHETGE